ncbi:Uncharacterized membrane protein YsdA, DUF1294 family [Roseovarius lutimaris]|uniref:Uncharacterized membrane protein YsdA, DUF1294 family n=1 Tax=Roseovarius lutimaris TaxID=1005928 RepID=A0A1I5CWM5_9RHOB|nr:DUF1294 domain-containing protein [Roseovarius lutimaris]SFN91364.1 Uncharacterized membrane protein YsdA, DUF1294 family [Roseovarius lutimaris]
MTPLAFVLSYFVILNMLTLGLFWWDKRCAIQRRWRLPESTLLTLCLIGGSLGAKAGQGIFRHKTRKEPFRTSLNAIAVLHVGFLAALVLPEFRASVVHLVSQISTQIMG